MKRLFVWCEAYGIQIRIKHFSENLLISFFLVGRPLTQGVPCQEVERDGTGGSFIPFPFPVFFSLFFSYYPPPEIPL